MRLRPDIFVKTVLLCALLPALPAAFPDALAQPKGAKLIWDLLDVRDTLSLTLRRADGTGDQPFFAACSAYGQIDLRLGAPLDRIEKAGEPVKITLTANRVSASVSGVSEIYQPTGSMRAFARITASDPVFAVLATGKAITLDRPAKQRVTWPAVAPGDVKFFIDACKTRSEH